MAHKKKPMLKKHKEEKKEHHEKEHKAVKGKVAIKEKMGKC